MKTLNCVMEYLYRDASNYKAFGEILLKGDLTKTNIEEIRSLLLDGEFFIAEQVNIPPLYDQLWRYSNGPTSDDHVFHELSNFRQATSQDIEELPQWGTLSDLLTKLRIVNNRWDCTRSAHCFLPFHTNHG